jgi:cytochrome P450
MMHGKLYIYISIVTSSSRVQQEVDEVLGSKTRVSEEDLEKLEYVEQVLKETLRLHAPFSILVPKEVPPEGVTLNGYHIPGGTQVMVGKISVFIL